MKEQTRKFLERLGSRVQGEEVALDIQGNGARVIKCHVDVIEEFWGEILSNDTITDKYEAMVAKNEDKKHGWRSILEVWHKEQII